MISARIASWAQTPPAQLQQAIVLGGESDGRTATLRLLDPRSLLEMTVVVRVAEQAAEFAVEISATGPMAAPLAYPYAFATEAGQWLILPVNEGIGYPVDDPSLRPMSYYLYGGHGLCMAWYGVAQGQEGLLTLIDTPDDAAVNVPSDEGLLRLAPQWLPQRGQFGGVRRMRYVLLEDGGYVAMCKRYREQVRQAGRLVTLAAKREKNPQVDQLIGAVNVWCWDADAVGYCRELMGLGIERILWSNRGTPESIRQLNDLGVLTSRYDIYQDVMNPENFPKLRGIHGDWTTKAWPQDLAIGADGQWTRGWEVQGKDGQWYPCGVLCDRQALTYARERLQNDLPSHPYRCRFIDTTTASPWRECYHPDHPMTRSESKHWKMELLRLDERRVWVGHRERDGA